MKKPAPAKTSKSKKKAAVKSARLSGTRKTRGSVVKRAYPLVRKTYKRSSKSGNNDRFHDFIRHLVLG